MDLLTGNKTQEYRLLMIRPDPESGECLCVGIVFKNDVVYDAKLSRLRCFSPDFDLSVARFYLDELREAVKRARGAHFEQTLSAYAPIFGFSTSRFVANPVTEKTKATLLARFVLRDHPKAIKEDRPSRDKDASERDSFSLKLQKLTSRYRESYDHVIENAKASDVLGRPYPGIDRVALAFKRLDRAIVMDGVDFQEVSPKKAISLSTKVVPHSGSTSE